MEELVEALASSAQNLRWMLEKSLMGLSDRELPALSAEISAALAVVGEVCSRLLGEEVGEALSCLGKAASKGKIPGEIAEKLMGAGSIVSEKEVDEASLYYLVEGLEELAAWLAESVS